MIGQRQKEIKGSRYRIGAVCKVSNAKFLIDFTPTARQILSEIEFQRPALLSGARQIGQLFLQGTCLDVQSAVFGKYRQLLARVALLAQAGFADRHSKNPVKSNFLHYFGEGKGDDTRLTIGLVYFDLKSWQF